MYKYIYKYMYIYVFIKYYGVCHPGYLGYPPLCEDYNTYVAHHLSPFLLRRAHPGPGPHTHPTPPTVSSRRSCDYRGYSLIRNNPPLLGPL